MELIITSLVVGSAVTFGVIRNIRKKNKIQELIEEKSVIFLEKVLNDEVVFRKVGKSGVFSNFFQAKDDVYQIDVNISSSEIFFTYTSNEGGKKQIYYHYLYDRKRKIGQITKMDEKIVLPNDLLFRKLEKKIIEYDWDNPLSFYAKETIRIFSKPSSSLQKTETDNPKITEMINQIERTYVSVKEDFDKYFNPEEKHNIERLYYKDLENLKQTYQKLPVKTLEEDMKMISSLKIILDKLKQYEDKLKGTRKHDFEKTIEVIKRRD